MMTLLLARPATLAALLGLALLLGMVTTPAPAADVKEGQPAPDIDLPATQIAKVLPDAKDAKSLKLKDLQGKKHVVLYFYPKALTGGWTAEACAFRDRIEQFAQLDTVIIGISADPLALQQKFTEKEKLNFPLYADTEKKAYQAFGVKGRETFVIDKKGTVVKVYGKVASAGAHPEEVLAWIKENLKK